MLDGYGDWSNKGCHNTTNNKTKILCECSHLTNFAILLVSTDRIHVVIIIMIYRMYLLLLMNQ